MDDCIIDSGQAIPARDKEELTKKLSGMDSKTIDSLLCNICSFGQTHEKCGYMIAFRKSEEDHANRETGAVGKMFYHFICYQILSNYQKNKSIEEKK